MNTCDTCQHWGVPYKTYGDNKLCQHITRGDGHVVYAQSVSPIHDNNFLSELFTGPKFGCIHHTPKAPTS